MADSNTSIHAGHRVRLRERLKVAGLDSFSEHEVLELLLTYAIPQRDVNPLAHELINTFGNLNAVLRADESELMRVKGMGPHAAQLLSMIPSLVRYVQLHACGQCPVIRHLDDAYAYLAPLFFDRGEEQVYLVCMDQSGRVLHRSLLHTGTMDQVALHPRKVVEVALRHRAQAVLLAHNHPSGTLAPSQPDTAITEKLSQTLSMLSLNLVDHLIFAGDKAYSMARGCVIQGTD